MRLPSRRKRTLSLSEALFFRGWTQDELAHVDRLAERVEFLPGELLLAQGTTGQEFLVLLEGEVEVRVNGEPVRTLGPGDHVGEMALLDGEPRTASVVARTPVRALLVGAREFRTLIDQVPSLDRKLLAGLTARLRAYQGNG